MTSLAADLVAYGYGRLRESRGVEMEVCLDDASTGVTSKRILVSAFLSIRAAVQSIGGYFLSMAFQERFNNGSVIANVSCSTLFIHGEADGLIPVDHSLSLFKRCRARKLLVTPPDMEHNSNLNYLAIPAIHFFGFPGYYTASPPRLPASLFETPSRRHSLTARSSLTSKPLLCDCLAKRDPYGLDLGPNQRTGEGVNNITVCFFKDEEAAEASPDPSPHLKGGHPILFLQQSTAETVQRVPDSASDVLEIAGDVVDVDDVELSHATDGSAKTEGPRCVKDKGAIGAAAARDSTSGDPVDEKADLDKAVKVVVDSKTNYCAACNSMETLLVHEKVAETFLPKLSAELSSKDDVRYKADEMCLPFLPKDISEAAQEVDFDTEFLCHTMAVKAVSSVDEAIEHINSHSSGHTDAIVTEDMAVAETFLRRIDSAGVYHNCSTRFADGFRYGFGAEVGISTNRIHARGPVGLEGLVIHKQLGISYPATDPYGDLACIASMVTATLPQTLAAKVPSEGSSTSPSQGSALLRKFPRQSQQRQHPDQGIPCDTRRVTPLNGHRPPQA
eukprot:s1382_g8.t3